MPRSSRFVSLLLIVSIALPTISGVASAQGDKIRFNCIKHLEGFQEADFNAPEYYDLTRFEAKNGRLVDRAELRAIQADWARAKTEGDLKRKEAESNTKNLFRTRLERRLQSHPYFRSRKEKWRILDGDMPIVYFVQNGPGKSELVAKQYDGWLRNVYHLFEEQYVKPLNLRRSDSFKGYGFAILQEELDYLSFANRIQSPGLNISRGHYNPDLKIVITYRGRLSSKEAQERETAMHELVHCMQHAHSTHGRDTIEPLWFAEGLADYLAGHKTNLDGDIVLEELPPEVVAQYAELRRLGNLLVLSLEDLIQVTSYDDVRQHAAKKGIDPHLALLSFYRQSHFLMYFLHHGQNGKYRDGVLRYIKECLQARGDLQAFRKSLNNDSMDRLSDEFDEFVFDTEEKYFGRPADTKEDPADPMEEYFAWDPSDFVLEGQDPERAIAEALVYMRDGEFKKARAVLEEASDNAAPSAQKDRIDRELARVVAMDDARDQFLEYLASGKKSLSIQYRGETVGGKVESFTGDQFVIKKRKVGDVTLPVNALDLAQLVDWMRKKKKPRRPDPWMEPYAKFIHGDPSEGASDTALLEDARDYPRLLQLARAYVARETLSKIHKPLKPEDVDRTVTLVEELLSAELAEAEPILETKESILELAREALTQKASKLEIKDFGLKGLSGSRDGKVQLSYPFNNSSELKDFRSLEPADTTIYELRPTEGREFSKLKTLVRRGTLKLEGLGYIEHKLNFEAPMSIEYTTSLKSMPKMTDKTFWAVGLCEGDGQFIVCVEFGTLIVRDERLSEDTPTEVSTLQIGKEYRIRLDHNGREIKCTIDGTEVSRSKVGTRKSGSAFIYVEADRPVVFSDFKIEGVVSEDSLAAFREDWILAKLAQWE